ncbi:MAG TPA: hypothetical protein ENJ65_03410, partial [Candidatus Tenderia electrophaga]|nr:hypothetical protein [Candidatus Tenderia electrophaga]
MEINGPPPSIIKPMPLPNAINSWQVGQVLQATVIKQAGPQSLILQVANQQLQAETSINLPAGQKLELRVSQLGDKPILQARILNPIQTSAPQANQPVATDAAINMLLKQALPKQASMASLLANLVWLNQSASKTAVIPAPVLHIIKQLVKQLPSRKSASNAGQLKQDILNSGIFLENKLSKLANDGAKQTDKPAADLKLSLLRLLGAIQKTAKPDNARPPHPLPSQTGNQANFQQAFTLPPLRGQMPQPQAQANANLSGLGNLPQLLSALTKQVESSLARTQLHQAASLPNSDQTPINLAFELPVRNQQHVDIFDISINEEEKNNPNKKDNKRQWSINLAFDLDGLGPVHSKLKMIDNKISTTFWSE